MKVSFRSASLAGSGRVEEFAEEFFVRAPSAPPEGVAVEVMIFGDDGICQARILGMVRKPGSGGFRVREAGSRSERERIRKQLGPR